MASGLCVICGSLVAQHFNYHVNDISVYLGRQRGGEGSRIERTHFTRVLFLTRSATFFALQTFETPTLWAETAR